MAREHIPAGMTAAQVNVLVGVRDGRVYQRRADGMDKDFMEDRHGTATGVGRQVTWLLDRGHIRKGSMQNKRAYYVLTVVGMIIAQDL